MIPLKAVEPPFRLLAIRGLLGALWAGLFPLFYGRVGDVLNRLPWVVDFPHLGSN